MEFGLPVLRMLLVSCVGILSCSLQRICPKKNAFKPEVLDYVEAAGKRR
ncbi:MAG: hypothetical protein ACE5KV_01215 [Thermoplasmata archaeon]